MKNLFAYFESYSYPMSLAYEAAVYSGQVTQNEQKVEDFEFRLRVYFAIEANYKLLSFYIKKSTTTLNLIENIVDNLYIYKEKANEVKVQNIEDAEDSFGNGDTIFANAVYFYVESELSVDAKEELAIYCKERNINIRIRSEAFADYMNKLKQPPPNPETLNEPEKAKNKPEEVNNININLINYEVLVNTEENAQLEFKSTLRIDLRTKSYGKHIEHSVIKTIAAFLNSNGGTLLIGVDDDKNVLGLDHDFNSFSGIDKKDKFQQHFDNLLKGFGDHVHHYLSLDFPIVRGKTICAISVKEKSSEPVFLKEDNKEHFYIRRQTSTVDLPMSQATKYIRDHWK